MESARTPRIDLAKKTLPKPLFRALSHVFSQKIDGCMLVGGTALSGFYAGHRRSDDLDLFTRDEPSFKSTVLAVKSLAGIGAKPSQITADSAQYFHATYTLEKHSFTVDVVLDANVFRVGSACELQGGIRVADLNTLLMTKAATLVSRCSEKDLYDLLWLFQEVPGLDFAGLVRQGHAIDGGVSAENILLSLKGAMLNKEACGFSLSKTITPEETFQKISKLRKELIQTALHYLKNEPATPLAELVRRISKL